MYCCSRKCHSRYYLCQNGEVSITGSITRLTCCIIWLQGGLPWRCWLREGSLLCFWGSWDPLLQVLKNVEQHYNFWHSDFNSSVFHLWCSHSDGVGVCSQVTPEASTLSFQKESSLGSFWSDLKSHFYSEDFGENCGYCRWVEEVERALPTAAPVAFSIIRSSLIMELCRNGPEN